MFEEDLKEWRKIEKEFVRRLLLKWDVENITFAPNKKFTDYDVKILFTDSKHTVKTFEVKYDKKSEETKNVWFEYRCHNKSSWIIKSVADVVVYYIDGKFYYQNREELLAKLLEINKFNTKWWDYNASDMVIVSKEHLNELFKELW